MGFFYILVLTLYGQLDRRITGGDVVTDPTAFPYIVAIAAQKQFKCGGVIIDEFWILTARHCFDDNFPIDDYYVEAGILDISAIVVSSPSSGRNVYDIESIVRNPSVDLALLKLKTALSFTDSVGRILLANSQDPLERGQSYVMAGWNGQISLMQAVTYHTCCPKVDHFLIVTGSVSIGTAQEKISWSQLERGDSGGPLVKGNVLYGINYKESTDYLQCGVIGDLNLNAHVKVSEQREWIESQTGLTLGNPAGTVSEDSSKNTCTLVPTCVPTTAGEKHTADNGGCHGDPHFSMWNSVKWFDYHGECDLVLVDNPALSSGPSLRIHVRTKIQSWYSFIFQAAISIDNEVMEMKRNKQFWLNGKSLNQPPANFSGYPMKSLSDSKWCHAKHCEGALIQKLDLGSDGYVLFTIWKGFIYIQVSADKGFWESTGLLGRRGQPGMFARNGSQLFDSQAFAEEWQVKKYERKLFIEDRYPQHPIPCIPPPPTHLSRRMDYDQPLRQMAEKACSEVQEDAREACIFDVWATGDLDLVSPYKQMEKYTPL